MSTPTTLDLEHRITALENTARRWRRISIAVILCSAAALLVAADSPGSSLDEIRTKKLVLLDDQGRTVGDLLYAKNKASGLRFYNPDTKFCVSGFGLGADGSGAEYINTREGKQVIIHSGAVNEKGVPLEDVHKALDQLRGSAIP